MAAASMMQASTALQPASMAMPLPVRMSWSTLPWDITFESSRCRIKALEEARNAVQGTTIVRWTGGVNSARNSTSSTVKKTARNRTMTEFKPMPVLGGHRQPVLLTGGLRRTVASWAEDLGIGARGGDPAWRDAV